MTKSDTGDTHAASRRAQGLHAALALLTTFALGACAATPTPVAQKRATPPPPPPPVQIYFYPTKGQTPAQQDRDRYECYLWAVKQTGFDPSTPQLAAHQRYEVVPQPPPGHDTAVGAATGAVIGAVVSPPGRTAEGAAVGAVTGAIVGAASDATRQEQAERVQQQYDRRDAARTRRLEEQAANYRRAMTACLEGRGYTVR